MSSRDVAAKGSQSLSRLYPWTIFLSAFLAFVVQPMEGKRLLPWFGGASSVWATGLLFFTSALFLGYLYVYLLTRLIVERQLLVHRIITVLAVGATLIPLLLRGSAPPELEWIPSLPPHLGVLLALLVSVGAPYLLLATTSPLLQYWWGSASGGEPYRLYALSNVGSLLALLAYPFFIEPHLSLPAQGWIWIFLVVLYAALLIWGTFCLPPGVMDGRSGEDATQLLDRRSWAMVTAWIGCAALPSYLLVAVTTQITQVVAPVPLLWTIPLALYLISFILAFRGVGGSILSLVLVLASVGFALWCGIAERTERAELQVLAALVLLFTAGLALHARLYSMRPGLDRLPLFFLLLGLGGVIGTLGGSLLPPLFFPNFWEYPLGVALVGGAVGGLLLNATLSERIPAGLLRAGQVAILALAGIGFAQTVSVNNEDRLALSRNFYGSAMVSIEGDLVVLSHGVTRHGSQFLDAERAPIPTAYYAPTSGAGRAAVFLQDRGGEGPVRFGLVGLGAGTLAAYCRPGDTFVFYELDPRITALARRYFSYLRMCPGVVVRHGDARIVLERERGVAELGGYDLLAVDAFSDDAVPVHLLTVEAFRLYLDHLAPGGLLAVHTSNVYIELAPVVTRIADELGWSALVVHDWEQSSPGAAGSDWVILAQEPSVFQAAPFATAESYLPRTEAPLWTDSYSSILPLLRGYQFVAGAFGR